MDARTQGRFLPQGPVVQGQVRSSPGCAVTQQAWLLRQMPARGLCVRDGEHW